MNRETLRRLLLIHPILFALFPVLSLATWVAEITPPLETWRVALAVCLLSVALYVATARLVKHPGKAAAVTSLTLLFFFTYYPATLRLKTFLIPNLLPQYLGPAIDIMWFVFAAIALSGAATAQRWPSIADEAFAAIGFSTALLFGFRLVSYEVTRLQPSASPLPRTCNLRTAGHEQQVLPDLYYIVLDGYARGDTLKALYEVDNEPFLSFLASRGFYIADKSRANYIQTRLSIAATLSMDYLDPALQRAQAEGIPWGIEVSRLIRDNPVFAFLRELGYRSVALETGFRVTELEDADIFLRPPGQKVSLFNPEYVFLDSTPLRPFLYPRPFVSTAPFRPGFNAHRRRINSLLDTLENDVPDLPGPKFVFAHLVTPHPPFVFQSDGSPVPPSVVYSPKDADHFPASREVYRKAYRQQVEYLNSRLPQVIAGILEQSSTPPVIILQSDHGPGLRLKWDAPAESDLLERTAILNALYLPGIEGARLYPSISPVNTFRLVISEYFGAQCPLLPDRSYFTSWSDPEDFQPIIP